MASFVGDWTGAIVGENNNTSGYGVFGSSSAGHGVHGYSKDGYGVYGIVNNATYSGVKGANSAGYGVIGGSTAVSSVGIGVYGYADGNYSTGRAGVWGKSASNIGVIGTSDSYYGIAAYGDGSSPTWGVMHLEPQDTAPTNGAIGDFYVSTVGKLYICTNATRTRMDISRRPNSLNGDNNKQK
jgi:hypothetical protein